MKPIVPALLFAALAPLATLAQEAAPLVWYDAERQAVAVDVLAEGWFRPPVDVDFDAAHAAAATVLRSANTAALGLTTEPGVFDTRSLYCPGTGWSATLTLYGWGARLGSLSPVTGYRSDVTLLDFWPSVVASDRIQYSAPTWDVASGRTVLFLRPLDAANQPIPVTPERAAAAWYRVGAENPWLPLPAPPPAPPVAAGLQLSPRTLALGSRGQWVTARLKLPAGLPVESVVVDSLRLALQSDQRDASGALVQSVRHTSGPLAVTGDDGLMVKFGRADLQELLFPGDATLTLTGRLADGTRFAATATIRIVP
jgi:hypothetical protein